MSYTIVTFAMPLYPTGLYMHHYMKEKLVNVDTESHHNTPENANTQKHRVKTNYCDVRIN